LKIVGFSFYFIIFLFGDLEFHNEDLVYNKKDKRFEVFFYFLGRAKYNEVYGKNVKKRHIIKKKD